MLIWPRRAEALSYSCTVFVVTAEKRRAVDYVWKIGDDKGRLAVNIFIYLLCFQ